MTRRDFVQRLALGAVATVSVPLPSARTASAAPALDPYGGVVHRVGDATGVFQVQKIGSRWVFVTPDGNPFWMTAVYSIDWADGGKDSAETYKTKYRGDQVAFTSHALRRLRSWGFNAIGPYSSAYAPPVATYGRKEGNPEKLPFIRLMNVAWYGSITPWDLAPGPFKTLLAGAVDPEIYTGWPGHTPDPFDPNFAAFARGLAGDLKTASRPVYYTEKGGTGGLPHPSLSGSPWLIGTTPDDIDFVFGMGPGPEVPGLRGVIHPHIGWIVAVTPPAQTQNREVGKAFGSKRTMTYTDTTVYAKMAWRDGLKKKYGTIGALNEAWGSTYSTFDSDGGWPMGRGLLDESGRGKWIGRDSERLSGTAPRVVADLDEFLGVFADQYFKTVSSAARAATPRHLVFSPAMLNGHKGLSRRPILRAAGRHFDAVEVNQHPDKPELIGITYKETGGRPMFTWMGQTANPDSAMYAHQSTAGVSAKTQEERAARYRRQVEMMLSYRADDGVAPIVGLAWWEYIDKWGEKANWGLVSPRHNAYDGKEATRASGVDAWGYPTGGEDRDYGDFLSSVRQVNAGIVKRLQDELPGVRGAR